MNRFIDSCQHYTIGNVTKKYTSIIGNWSIGVGLGARGGNVLRHDGTGTGENFSFNVARTFDDQDTWTVGFRCLLSSFGFNPPLIRFYDGISGTVQCLFGVLTDGRVAAYRGNASTLLGASIAVPLNTGTYFYLEFQVKIHPTAGYMKMRIDNTLVINLTGINTQASANSSASQVQIGPGQGNSMSLFHDIYIHDGQGSDDIDFWGDTEIEYSEPVANGDTNDYTPVGSLINFENVDEIFWDPSDYNSSNNVGDIELYKFNTVSTDAFIKSVQLVAMLDKDDGNDRRVQLSTKSGGTVFNGAAQDVPASSRYLTERFPTNPDTGDPWLNTEIGGTAAQFGVETEN